MAAPVCARRPQPGLPEWVTSGERWPTGEHPICSLPGGVRRRSRGGRVEEEDEDRSIDPSEASREARQILPMDDRHAGHHRRSYLRLSRCPAHHRAPITAPAGCDGSGPAVGTRRRGRTAANTGAPRNGEASTAGGGKRPDYGPCHRADQHGLRADRVAGGGTRIDGEDRRPGRGINNDNGLPRARRADVPVEGHLRHGCAEIAKLAVRIHEKALGVDRSPGCGRHAEPSGACRASRHGDRLAHRPRAAGAFVDAGRDNVQLRRRPVRSQHAFREHPSAAIKTRT